MISATRILKYFLYYVIFFFYYCAKNQENSFFLPVYWCSACMHACVLWGDPNVIQSNPKTVAFKFSYPCKKAEAPDHNLTFSKG